jgi:hypothetical protein
VNGVVITMRPCPTCGRSSRVGGKCGACLTEELEAYCRGFAPEGTPIGSELQAELDRLDAE